MKYTHVEVTYKEKKEKEKCDEIFLFDHQFPSVKLMLIYPTSMFLNKNEFRYNFSIQAFKLNLLYDLDVIKHIT